MKLIYVFIFFLVCSCSSDSEEYKIVKFGKSNSNPTTLDALLYMEVVDEGRMYKIIHPDSEEKISGILYSLGKGDMIKLSAPEDYGYDKGVNLSLVDFKDSKKVQEFEEGFEAVPEPESLALKLFLFDSEIDFKFHKGMFVSWLEKSGSGVKGIKNSIYRIDMECSLLDGTKVFSTDLSRSLFEFNKSMPGQVTEGLASIFEEMEEGDELILLVPSKLSFGEKGVGDGIIPPNAPLLYSLKLIEIIL
jgi:hypothetical protein